MTLVAPLASQTESMELLAELDAPCSADELFAWVDDLDRYPQWLGIVHRTEAIAQGDTADRLAWKVDLRAQLGPLARSKRLRMERTQHEPDANPRLAVFERNENDGRDHGRWTLRAEVHEAAQTPDGAATPGSRLVMTLRYDGRLWGPALAGVLKQEVERSRQRLLDLVS